MAYESYRFLNADSTLVKPHDEDTIAKEDLIIWRRWIEEVFIPLNLEMVKTITDHADLLEEFVMPDCLLNLNAHVQTYKAVIKGWEAGDYSTHFSVIPFPREALEEYTSLRYTELKKRQAELL